MKFFLLVEESHKEYDYVRQEPTRTRGPFVVNPYEDTEDKEDDYSDLDAELVEVSDKEEKLLPDEDLKWEEDEEKEEEATPYEGGAPDEET